MSRILGCIAIVSTIIAGCSHKNPATPQVFLTSELLVGNNSTSCRDPGDWVDIGSRVTTTDSNGVTTTNYTLVPDGQEDKSDNITVAVSCSVTGPSAGPFSVDATAATTSGLNAGTVHIVGTMTPSGTQSNITATFQKTTATFSETDCTVTFPTSPMGVASGRVWGVIDCPTAQFSSQGETCEGTAEFRFENCEE